VQVLFIRIGQNGSVILAGYRKTISLMRWKQRRRNEMTWIKDRLADFAGWLSERFDKLSDILYYKLHRKTLGLIALDISRWLFDKSFYYWMRRDLVDKEESDGCEAYAKRE
jgi:hypothetical protein